MGRRGRGAAVVALVLLLGCAGCSAPLGDRPADGAGGSAGDATVTPAPVPAADGDAGGPGRDADELAPGVTDEGVVDPVRLGAAHDRALSGVAYTAHRNVTRRNANGSRRDSTRLVVQVSGDGDRFLYELGLMRGRRLEIDRYGDGERIYERETSSNGTRYALVLGPDGTPLAPGNASYGDPTNRRGIVDLLARLQFEVTDVVELDGGTHYRLATEGPRALPPARNITARLLVREDGLVREYAVAYRVERGDETTVVRLEGGFTGVGTTTVPEPAWYPTARNATDDPTTRTATDDSATATTAPGTSE